jgi:hypothetical protein
MTLDVIGLAGSSIWYMSRLSNWLTSNTGFNYKFDQLNADEELNELSQAFAIIFRASTRISFVTLLQALFPILKWIVSTIQL